MAEKIGLGIGIPIGILLVGMSMFFFFQWRKLHRLHSTTKKWVPGASMVGPEYLKPELEDTRKEIAVPLSTNVTSRGGLNREIAELDDGKG